MFGFIAHFMALGAVCALLALGCSSTDEAPGSTSLREKEGGESVAVEVNSPAPAFAARVMGGGQARLTDYMGKVVVLEFWSIFCKSCLQEMPAIKELHKKYADDGLAVLSVNTDAFSDTRVLKVLEKAGLVFDYPVLRDTRRELADAYNVEILPVTVIIDRSGWIRLYQEGYSPGEEESFEDVIKSCLGDEEEEGVLLAPRGGVTQFAPTGVKALKREGKVDEALERDILSGGKLTVGGAKPMLLFFWSLYCKPCRAEFPAMENIRARWAASGLQVASVNVDSARLEARVRNFLKPYPDLPCLPDWPENKRVALADVFGVSATPSVVLMDGEGNVVFAAEGIVSAEELEARVEALMVK